MSISASMTPEQFVNSTVLLTRRWRAIMGAELCCFGLTFATCRALFYLGELGDGVRPKDLAETLDMERPSLGQLVDRLEHQGFVTRRNDSDDRRGKTLHLTPAGREIYRRTADVAATVRRELLAGQPKMILKPVCGFSSRFPPRFHIEPYLARDDPPAMLEASD